MQTHINFVGLNNLFAQVAKSGRECLLEHEVYQFIQLIGGETPPQFYFLKNNDSLDEQKLLTLPGEHIVVKVVSEYILHKSDVGGVRITGKKSNEVLSTLRQMSIEIPQSFAQILACNADKSPINYRSLEGEQLIKTISNDIMGYLLCQYMKPDSEEFGNELLVSLRYSREFGMIISAGLGGRDTELYAARFKKGQAIVSASVEQVDGQKFFEIFQNTISYKKLAGLTRGQKRIVTDSQLLECFEAFVQVGQYFSPSNNSSPFSLVELEINPFAFSNYLMMPLDGLCRFNSDKLPATIRPVDKIDKLLHPSTIGIVGISSKKINVGRIILNNILANGFNKKSLVLIHPDGRKIDTIATTPGLTAMATKVDLLILAVEGSLVPDMIVDILQHNLAESVILISGGLGEHDTQEHLVSEIQANIAEKRQGANEVAVFLGANSLGILSHPGNYDAMFIPDTKLPKKRGHYQRKVALVSQSGAYMITRMSTLSFLDPAYAISIGNQIDLTAGDFLHYLNNQDELQTLAFYMEGFTDLDGLSFVRAIRTAINKGKEVIFYKAGRTPEGKDALSGHTASIAGDYMVCESCISQAGAMVAETFNEFEGLLRLSWALYDKNVTGNRLAAVSNAGYEAVGIADNILGEDYRLEMAKLSESTLLQLAAILTRARLEKLTGLHNPLDITPMASEEVYVDVINSLLDDSHTDVVIAAIVPLTPLLHTLPEEIEEADHFGSLYSIIEKISILHTTSAKPLVIVVDSGKLYDPLADGFEKCGMPVFRSADIAVTVLGKYIHNRLHNQDSLSAD